jgi:phenylacetic acid degradation operon negative regulatory protein
MKPERNTLDVGAPLPARSVIASLLLGTDPPRLAGRRLVRTAERFGFSENATRVALSRMVGAGELALTDGDYGLAGPLLERRRRQEAGRRPALRPWDGTWVVAVVGATSPRRSAGQRSSARLRLRETRMAEWREGVWTRPDNLGDPRPAIPGCAWLLGARPEDAPPVAELWDVGAWAGRARAMLAAMAGTPPSGDHPEPSFRLAAAVVRHLRDDPLLPEVLLPAEWPGDKLRAAYDGYEAAFQAALRPVLRAS